MNKIFTLLLLTFSISSIFAKQTEREKNNYKYALSICTIFQNDAPYLKEWIEFHRLVGVEHFYLFNNLSSDDYEKVLNPYIKEGIVDLIEWPHPSTNVQEWDLIQIAGYNEGLRLAKGKTKWLAILVSNCRN